MKYTVVLAVGHNQIADQIKKFDEVEVIDENDDIEIIEEVLEFISADYAIINTMLSKEKSLNLARRARELNVKVICIIDEEKIDKELILGLAGCGVTAMVPIDCLYRIPEYLDSYPASFDYQMVHGREEILTVGNNSRISLQKKKATVAVLGIMQRIGTTTQALRLAKYLNDKGYRTAYIELNGSGYIKRLAETYVDAASDKKIGKVTYKDLDMFYEPSYIPVILRQPYLFYIYDFGDIHELKSREQITWLEKDIKVLVTGTKPNEIEQMQYAVRKVYQQNTKYIFNFCSRAEQQDVLEMMGTRKDVTYFADWAPDPFAAGADCDYFSEMMADAMAKAGDPIGHLPNSGQQPKKRRFWKRK